MLCETTTCPYLELMLCVFPFFPLAGEDQPISSSDTQSSLHKGRLHYYYYCLPVICQRFSSLQSTTTVTLPVTVAETGCLYNISATDVTKFQSIEMCN